MSKSDWRNLGLALSFFQCAYAVEHRKGKHRVLNKACMMCLLKWVIERLWSQRPPLATCSRRPIARRRAC